MDENDIWSGGRAERGIYSPVGSKGNGIPAKPLIYLGALAVALLSFFNSGNRRVNVEFSYTSESYDSRPVAMSRFNQGPPPGPSGLAF